MPRSVDVEWDCLKQLLLSTQTYVSNKCNVYSNEK